MIKDQFTEIGSKHSRYNKRHPDRLKVKRARLRARDRSAVLEALGGKCLHCGITDPRVLQADHINGGGTKDRASVSVEYNRYILKSIQANEHKYQLLCANCNWIKRHEMKEVK